jgi:hypothetical protein
MPLEQSELDVAVAKYKEYRDNGFKNSEIRAEIKADPAKYKAGEIDEILDALYAAPAAQGQDEAEADPGFDPSEPDKPVISSSKGLNKDYEEWTVDPQWEDIRNEMDKITGRKIVGWTKLKKLRVTRVTVRIAEELNSQSQNTLLRLFPITSKP